MLFRDKDELQTYSYKTDLFIMLSQISLLFLKGKKTMKMLEGTEYDMEWRVGIYRDQLSAHEVKGCNLTNDKHIYLLHDN